MLRFFRTFSKPTASLALSGLLACLMLGVSVSNHSAHAKPGSSFDHSAPRVVAVVDLSDQMIRVFRSGVLMHSWKVSTARRGYITPVGKFTPYRTHKMWRSRKYDNAPMPYSVFYHKGWAVHGTNAVKRLGRPASHGCVRLHPKHAKTLYKLVRKVGMKNAQIVVRH